MKEEEGRCHAAVEAFSVAEKSIQDLKNKLLEEERERKSAALTLDNVERQVESQQVLLRNAKDQLSASKAQTTAFKKNLEKPRRLGMMQRGLGRKRRGLGSRPSKMDMI